MIAQAEKEKLFDQILTEHRESLQLFARNNTDGHNCEDLEQEIRLQIWASLDRYEGRSSLKTWFYSVAMNALRNFNRTRRNAERGKRLLGIAMTSRGTAANTERIYMLEQFIQTLDEDDRTVLLMYLDRCRYHEISEATSLDEGALRMRVCRLKKQLSEYAGK